MVERELGVLNPQSAAGPENLHGNLLKAARFEPADGIAHLFNSSLEQSIVQTQWKDATVIPFAKTPNPVEPVDFRPISLIATICKVLEKILAILIINITKDTWKDNQQFGYLPNRSTSDAIV